MFHGERGRQHVPIPDSGSLRQDLIAYAKAIVVSVTTPEIDAIVRAVASTSDRDSKLARASRIFWTERFAHASEMINRAAARGEISPAADATLILEAVVAPIYVHLLVSHQEPDLAFIEQLATFAVSAAAQT